MQDRLTKERRSWDVGRIQGKRIMLEKEAGGHTIHCPNTEHGSSCVDLASTCGKSIARRIRRTSCRSFLRASSCCQTRRTFHPLSRSVLVTKRSRALFAASFFSQNLRFVAGTVPCFGHPCQKHPSTNTASRAPGNRKSGFPKRLGWRRQPLRVHRRKNAARATSVRLLPRPRTRDMSLDRFALV
jgi:hypothetical protein